ncbi:hypothetical protein EHO04_19195 [Salmonella enterica]|nr:hypothetical protein [Salmonella enterica]
MRYFFMAEPIRAMEGDLLGVEIITHFASSPARPLHPEFVISSWDNSQKRRFLLDLLRTIAAKHGWFLRHGLFCIVNIDRGMAQLVLQDKDIRALLHAMLFVDVLIHLKYEKKPGGHWIIRDLMGLDLVGLASL